MFPEIFVGTILLFTLLVGVRSLLLFWLLCTFINICSLVTVVSVVKCLF